MPRCNVLPLRTRPGSGPSLRCLLEQPSGCKTHTPSDGQQRLRFSPPAAQVALIPSRRKKPRPSLATDGSLGPDTWTTMSEIIYLYINLGGMFSSLYLYIYLSISLYLSIYICPSLSSIQCRIQTRTVHTHTTAQINEESVQDSITSVSPSPASPLDGRNFIFPIVNQPVQEIENRQQQITSVSPSPASLLDGRNFIFPTVNQPVQEIGKRQQQISNLPQEM